MFCFPNTGYVITLLRTVSLKFLSYSRAYLRVIYEKTKGQVPPGPLLGKQNIHAKDVYYGERSEPRENARETEHPSHSRDFARLPQMVWETAHLPKFGYPSL